MRFNPKSLTLTNQILTRYNTVTIVYRTYAINTVCCGCIVLLLHALLLHINNVGIYRDTGKRTEAEDETQEEREREREKEIAIYINGNVNVHVYSPGIPMSSADCTITTLVLGHIPTGAMHA